MPLPRKSVSIAHDEGFHERRRRASIKECNIAFLVEMIQKGADQKYLEEIELLKSEVDTQARHITTLIQEIAKLNDEHKKWELVRYSQIQQLQGHVADADEELWQKDQDYNASLVEISRLEKLLEESNKHQSYLSTEDA